MPTAEEGINSTPDSQEIVEAIDDRPLHIFERAGLGIAPFRIAGVCWSAFGSSCDYCGHEIMEICTIQDSGGRTFKVGNVCVEKTGDAGLIHPMREELKRMRREAKQAKDDLRVEAARVKLQDVKESLASEPHPFAYLADKGKTLLDYVEWLLENGGRSGKVRAAKMIEQSAAGLVPCELSPGWVMLYRLLSVHANSPLTENQ